MSYYSNTAVTPLVTEEATTAEGLSIMLTNAAAIAKGPEYHVTVEKVIDQIRDVARSFCEKRGGDVFRGQFLLSRFEDEIIFTGKVGIDLGAGYKAVLSWETLQEQGNRMTEVVIAHGTNVLTQKAKRFDPYYDRSDDIVDWISVVIEAIGQSEDSEVSSGL